MSGSSYRGGERPRTEEQRQVMTVLEKFRKFRPYLRRRLKSIEEARQQREHAELVDDIKFFLDVMNDLIADEHHGTDTILDFIESVQEIIRTDPNALQNNLLPDDDEEDEDPVNEPNVERRPNPSSDFSQSGNFSDNEWNQMRRGNDNDNRHLAPDVWRKSDPMALTYCRRSDSGGDTRTLHDIRVPEGEIFNPAGRGRGSSNNNERRPKEESMGSRMLPNPEFRKNIDQKHVGNRGSQYEDTLPWDSESVDQESQVGDYRESFDDTFERRPRPRPANSEPIVSNDNDSNDNDVFDNYDDTPPARDPSPVRNRVEERYEGNNNNRWPSNSSQPRHFNPRQRGHQRESDFAPSNRNRQFNSRQRSQPEQDSLPNSRNRNSFNSRFGANNSNNVPRNPNMNPLFSNMSNMNRSTSVPQIDINIPLANQNLTPAQWQTIRSALGPPGTQQQQQQQMQSARPLIPPQPNMIPQNNFGVGFMPQSNLYGGVQRPPSVTNEFRFLNPQNNSRMPGPGPRPQSFQMNSSFKPNTEQNIMHRFRLAAAQNFYGPNSNTRPTLGRSAPNRQNQVNRSFPGQSTIQIPRAPTSRPISLLATNQMAAEPRPNSRFDPRLNRANRNNVSKNLNASGDQLHSEAIDSDATNNDNDSEASRSPTKKRVEHSRKNPNLAEIIAKTKKNVVARLPIRKPNKINKLSDFRKNLLKEGAIVLGDKNIKSKKTTLTDSPQSSPSKSNEIEIASPSRNPTKSVKGKLSMKNRPDQDIPDIDDPISRPQSKTTKNVNQNTHAPRKNLKPIGTKVRDNSNRSSIPTISKSKKSKSTSIEAPSTSKAKPLKVRFRNVVRPRIRLVKPLKNAMPKNSKPKVDIAENTQDLVKAYIKQNMQNMSATDLEALIKNPEAYSEMVKKLQEQLKNMVTDENNDKGSSSSSSFPGKPKSELDKLHDALKQMKNRKRKRKSDKIPAATKIHKTMTKSSDKEKSNATGGETSSAENLDTEDDYSLPRRYLTRLQVRKISCPTPIKARKLPVRTGWEKWNKILKKKQDEKNKQFVATFRASKIKLKLKKQMELKRKIAEAGESYTQQVRKKSRTVIGPNSIVVNPALCKIKIEADYIAPTIKTEKEPNIADNAEIADMNHISFEMEAIGPATNSVPNLQITNIDIPMNIKQEVDSIPISPGTTILSTEIPSNKPPSSKIQSNDPVVPGVLTKDTHNTLDADYEDPEFMRSRSSDLEALIMEMEDIHGSPPLPAKKNRSTKPDVFNCKLCPFRGKQIVAHYANMHLGSTIPEACIADNIFEKLVKQNVTASPKEFEIYCNDEYDKDNPWNCLFCPEIYDDVREFFEHLTTHTGEFIYSCKKCFVRHPHLKALTNHLIQFHKLKEDTGEVAENLHTLYEPTVSPGGNALCAYLCSNCHYFQLLPDNIAQHLEVEGHSPEKAISIKFFGPKIGSTEIKEDPVKTEDAEPILNFSQRELENFQKELLGLPLDIVNMEYQ